MMEVETSMSAARLAKRLDGVGFSDIVKVRNKVMELRGRGETVHAFHGGEPFFSTADSVKQAMVQAVMEDKTKYAPSSGILPLRKAIVEKLQTRNRMKDVVIDDVIVTVGGAHALWTAFQAVLNGGDEVLIFSPYWTPIADMVRAAEAVPVFVPTEEARRDGVSETLARYATKATRAIYYNTPQNPSGRGVHASRGAAGGSVCAGPRPAGDCRRSLRRPGVWTANISRLPHYREWRSERSRRTPFPRAMR